jgi:hypothetical protein
VVSQAQPEWFSLSGSVIAKPTAQAIRRICFGFIALALVGVPAGFLDLLAKNGS